MAMRRFVARRGSPVEIYSDNGTNFLGAKNDLVEECKTINTELATTFTNTVTKWYFNPPSAPHMGGAWERLVRSVKTAFFAMTTSRTPNEETFSTVLVEAEAVVNSRPLTFISLENDSQEALTPNHFLLLSSTGIGQPRMKFVESGLALRDDWNHNRHLVDIFWHRWVKEYLPIIARRTKWFEETKSLEPGTLVVIIDESIRNGWTRGRVLDVMKGADGRVRRATVQTSKGLITRPVAKLAVLDVAPEKVPLGAGGSCLHRPASLVLGVALKRRRVSGNEPPVKVSSETETEPEIGEADQQPADRCSAQIQEPLLQEPSSPSSSPLPSSSPSMAAIDSAACSYNEENRQRSLAVSNVKLQA
ncbi:uncharacterized protein LOC129753247 [Uranotaenia lowii]|uniref:uncharacterized protein LOC129753247 n=1 Tax=Uranotaenia lowii TaxID=190385 RepID=UPI002478CF9E|nr:uncharacterized protein LOC129753247 [Uranotaenia lowii]